MQVPTVYQRSFKSGMQLIPAALPVCEKYGFTLLLLLPILQGLPWNAMGLRNGQIIENQTLNLNVK